jgi:thiol-disulfide isomerase/thioredoxin
MKIPRFIVVAILLILPFASAALGDDAERIKALEEKVAALELALDKKITDMEARIGLKIEEAIQAMARREEEAMRVVSEISALANQGKQEAAKQRVEVFKKKYAGTEAAKKTGRLFSELEVVGKAAPAQMNVEKWLAGGDAVADLAGDKVSVLLFWEVWCPHCKREVPKMQATYEKFKGSGFQVIGLTKINRGATEEKVMDFIGANNMTYPVAKENGDLSRYFNVSGVPAAAVIKGGKVVWRGHPSRLNERMIQGWL